MAFAYDIVVSPGPGDSAVAQKWVKRLSDPATINEIKSAISAIDWREVLNKAAMGFEEFIGTDDPRRALAALKHSAALAVTDADEAKQKLINALDQYYADRVSAAQDKFTMRTKYILPAVNAVRNFTANLYDWLKQKYGGVARYLRGAATAPAMFAAYLGVVFADAAKAGSVTEEQAEQVLGSAAGDLKQILDIIVAKLGVQSTVTVDIDPNTPKAIIHVEIPEPSQGGG